MMKKIINNDYVILESKSQKVAIAINEEKFDFSECKSYLKKEHLIFKPSNHSGDYVYVIKDLPPVVRLKITRLNKVTIVETKDDGEFGQIFEIDVKEVT